MSFRSKTIVAAAALSGLFYPSAGNPATLLQAIKKRIKRSDVETQSAF
jgi:hypothetical protein